MRKNKMNIEPIEQGKYYHIYNRGINGTKLFNENENYLYFLRLYEKYIEPIAETFAWCLMGNHFHLLVYIKTTDEIIPEKLSYSTVETPKIINASKQFAHMFNSYSQSFNKKYRRTGGLFETPFERKNVNNMTYFRTLIFYIHYNPVHHGFCERLQDYPWSSYGSVISIKPTKIKREKIIGYFDSVGNFIDYHKQQHDFNDMRDMLFD